jgi:CPA1 family monovalent cation:H+ antiporter
VENFSVATLGVVLLTASVVAMISRRLNLPYSTGLVAAGIVLALLPAGINIQLSHDLVFTVLLPPLVFEAALQLKWQPFKRELPITLLLAFGGVTVAAAAIASGAHALLGWSWWGAGLFGFLIAATDPVSVIAAFRDMNVESRLSLILEAESLLNDGAAAVGFAVLLALAGGLPGNASNIAATLSWIVLGGVSVGVIVAGAVLLLAGRTKDHLVEITLTTIAAYGSFLLAEHLAMSGVLASVSAGLVVGNIGWRDAISERGRGHVLAFWEYAAFLANSIVFIAIGSEEAHQSFGLFSYESSIAIILVLIGRAFAVYPLCAVFLPTRLRLDMRYQHVLVWGGLRGALGLALALSLPENLAERQQIVVTAFAVVAFSIFAQGLSMPWLIRRLGLRSGPKKPRPEFRSD